MIRSINLVAIAIAMSLGAAVHAAAAAGPEIRGTNVAATREFANHLAGIIRSVSASNGPLDSETMGALKTQIIPQIVQLNWNDSETREIMEPVIKETEKGINKLLQQYEQHYEDLRQKSFRYDAHQAGLLNQRDRWIIFSVLNRIQTTTQKNLFAKKLDDYRNALEQDALHKLNAEIYATAALWHEKPFPDSVPPIPASTLGTSGPLAGNLFHPAPESNRHFLEPELVDEWRSFIVEHGRELKIPESHVDVLVQAGQKISKLEVRDAQELRSDFQFVAQNTTLPLLYQGLLAAQHDPTSSEVSQYVRMLKTAYALTDLAWIIDASTDLDLLRWEISVDALANAIQQIRMRHDDETLLPAFNRRRIEAPSTMEAVFKISAMHPAEALSGFQTLATLPLLEKYLSLLGRKHAEPIKVEEYRTLVIGNPPYISIVQKLTRLLDSVLESDHIISNDFGKTWYDAITGNKVDGSLAGIHLNFTGDPALPWLDPIPITRTGPTPGPKTP